MSLMRLKDDLKYKEKGPVMSTFYSIPDLPELDQKDWQLGTRNRTKNGAVKYVVDSSGAGTHKTIADAVKDAEEYPMRTTMITIRPHIRLEDFL